MKFSNINCRARMGGTALAAIVSVMIAVPAAAQDAAPASEDETGDDRLITITGSNIKQDPTKSALPLQIISTQELAREGITSPEQLISYLSTNGNGADNLASNTDVTSGAQRGNNGLSAANLRGQGSAATLVLLNGRRVAAHGLKGSAVDVNQIPFAALQRVEVLKDGASAIYGTDAIGGVINFITKTDFQGVNLNGFTDVTQRGDSPIYRLSATAGYGDLNDQGFNIMGSVSWRKAGALEGSERKFVNGNQPERGLSIDTRGTPIATIFANGANALFAPNGSLLSGLGNGLEIPGSGGILATGGVNPLDLPGGAGCESFDGGQAYDAELWAFPQAQLACAWDTGRAAVLQQPLETLTYYGRATVKLGDHQAFAEVTGSDADSTKRFSSNQYAGNTSTTPLFLPLNALTAETYNQVFNQLVDFFPAVAANFGKPIAYRWRCTICGPREFDTNTKTFRLAGGIDGPITDGWDYRAGASYARSTSKSVLGSGYHFRGIFSSTARAIASGIPGAVFGGLDTRAPTAPGASAPGIVGLLNSGIINPFSLTQTPEALAALDSISAEGTELYGGKFEVTQLDGSVSGTLFALPGGDVQVAVGFDYRRETYTFNGSAAAEFDRPEIFNVPFDNTNALDGRSRTIKAAYAEVLVPVFDMLEVTGAVRMDDYTGFGTTVNPKFSAKFTPAEWLLFRGSYNTGFRAPAFNQVFNGQSVSPNPGNNLVDPTTCTLAAPNPAVPGCEPIFPDSVRGGNPDLGPETSEQYSVGMVLRPTSRISASFDFWSVSVDDVIGSLTVRELMDNIAFFPERITRDGSGTITLLDLTSANIGSRRTKGLEVSLRAGMDALGGELNFSLDGTRLLKKKEKFLPAAPFGPSRIGVFSFNGDLGLRWKHNATVRWGNDKVDLSFTQIFRNGYENQALPGIASGAVTRPGFNERVKNYIIYNFSAGLKINEQFRIIGGVRNLFDKEPPFAITYNSNTGAGSSWEPRVADPRGRSFTISVDANF